MAERSAVPREIRAAFFLRDASPEAIKAKSLTLNAADFTLLNPNTCTMPVFRDAETAEIVKAIYRHLPVLVRHEVDGAEIRQWPVKYERMLDMGNDAKHFQTLADLEKLSAWPLKNGTYKTGKEIYYPLYVGRMIYAYDHRNASVEVNAGNLHNKANSKEVTPEEKADPNFLPQPQYWVAEKHITIPKSQPYVLGFRDITNATNERTVIAAITPKSAAGHTLPLLRPTDWSDAEEVRAYNKALPFMLANLNALVFDFVACAKIQSTHLCWYMLEQLPVVPLDEYEKRTFGGKSAAAIIRETVLELTCTARNLAPFACDQGYVDEAGEVLPPSVWDEQRRLRLKSRLDAVYFLLYGVTKPEKIRFIYDSFPIVRKKEEKLYGAYASREMAIHALNALKGGDADYLPPLPKG